MDAAVYQDRHTAEQFLLGQRTVHRRQFIVDAGCRLEVYPAFEAEQPGLHVQQVVRLTLLESGIVALLLELLRLEIVARVVFVRDGERSDVHLHQAVQDVPLAANGKHLQHTFLRAVVGILGTPFALGNPDGLPFRGDGVVHIA